MNLQVWVVLVQHPRVYLGVDHKYCHMACMFGRVISLGSNGLVLGVVVVVA